MKILTSAQMKAWNAYTIASEFISSNNLMERAAATCTDFILQQINYNETITIVCGQGNNGAEGLAIARHLFLCRLPIQVFVVTISATGSDDFEINLKKLTAINCKIIFIQSAKDITKPLMNGIVIDALVGTGIHQALHGLHSEVVNVINQCNAKIISIDIPSGMFVDTCSLGNSIVEADYTITFQTNKLCFLFAENEKYIGEVIVNNIGLNDEFIEKIESPYYLSNDATMQSIYKPRNVFSHKGSHGHALLIAGNVGKMGAAVIAAKACLRSGVGLSTVAIPSTERLILQASLPEAMYINRKESLELEKYASIGIGPGIGTAPQEVELLKNILIHSTKPIVIDADAINILSANKELIKCIPKNSIITPHAKEFDRLVGEAKNEWHRMDQAIQFSKENNCVLVLKGHHTMIIYDQEIWFNHTGNSGLAKGGSGDALTGIITALLAQGYTSADAAKFGVYLHGKAADLALENQSAESMLISDVIEKIGMVFKQLI